MTTITKIEDIDQTIFHEQTRLLYETVPLVTISSMVNALILAYLEWDFIDRNTIFIWLTLMVVASLFRIGSWVIYNRSESKNRPAWIRIFIAHAFIVGAVWGSAAVLLFPADDIIGQTIITFVFGGVAAGSITFYSYMRITGIGFLTIMLTPLCLHFFMFSQHQFSTIMGFLVLLFYITMISSSLRSHKDTRQNIELTCQSILDSITIRASKEEAERANKAKSSFLSAMSHELRTPLSAIIGYAEILKEEAGPLNEEQMESADHILSAGKHLLGLINEVLDLAKVESEDAAMSLSVIKPGPELEQCMAIAKSMSKKYGVTVQEQESNLILPEIMADPARLKQVMINLLSNAIKYNHRGGYVTLGYENNGTNKLRIKVTDTGLGIAKNKQAELFVPFNRLGAEDKNIEGTGIGLAITQKLAERMGADLSFESQEGKGSTFWIDVPLAKKSA